MLIFKKLRWKNFLSSGNNFNELEVKNSGLTLITSEKNGEGKCLDKNTKINIQVDKDIEDEFRKFMNKR